MKILSIVFMVIVGLSHASILLCVAYNVIDSIKLARKKKADKKNGKSTDEIEFVWDEDDDKDYRYVPELSKNALRELKPDRIGSFVLDEMLPAAPRVLAYMTMTEELYAKQFLTACIGFLLDTAPEEEHDFSVLLELLENAKAPEYDECSVTERVFEDSKDQSGVTEFYKNFRNFKTRCTNIPYVVHCCTEIVSIITVKLYGYIPVSVTDKSTFENEGEYEYDTL